MTITYNLQLLCNVSKTQKDDLISNNKLSEKQVLDKDKEYTILRYNKSELNNCDINTDIGLYRSVILLNEKIMAFSPPKSLDECSFMSKYNPDECSAEEIIEGTMINLFYDPETSNWEISTKSTINACNTFFTNDKDYLDTKQNKTFRNLFLEVCKHINFDYTGLNNKYCYSFVFQHPENKIVIPINEYRLYLISAYCINNTTYTITQLEDQDKLDIIKDTNIMIPQSYEFTSYDDIEAIILCMNDTYKDTGIMIHHIDGARCKIRNPAYEFVKMLRGNQPKLKYRYIELRQKGQVSAYLNYFPEAYNDFIDFQKEIHSFTEELYENYIRCYIKKEKPLLEFEEKQHRKCMYNLHLIYKDELKAKGKKIIKQEVINYVNKLHPSILMDCLNYKLKN